MKNKRILFITQFSMLLAIEAIVCFTPLGSLPIGPLVATLSHIPVIICAVTLGIGPGTLLGFFFGLFSFIIWTFMPPSPALAFVFTPFYSFGDVGGNFWSLVICFVPRILIGTFSGLVYKAFSSIKIKFDKNKFIAYIMAGIVGSLTNTLLVLGGIYVFFGEPYAAANGLAYDVLLGAIMTTILTNGILETVLAVICAAAIGHTVNKYLLKRS